MSNIVKLKTETYISLRESVIYKHVWSLSQEERDKLDSFSIYRIQVRELLALIETHHIMKDTMTTKHVMYDISYIDTSLDHLESLSETDWALLSFRRHNRSSIALCLVKVPKQEIVSSSEFLDFRIYS